MAIIGFIFKIVFYILKYAFIFSIGLLWVFVLVIKNLCYKLSKKTRHKAFAKGWANFGDKKEKNPEQKQIDSWVKKRHFSGSGKYYREETAFIMYWIKKENIKPTDGLEKLLYYSDKIGYNLSKNVSQYFNYLIDNLSDLRKSTPHSFKAATSHPSQMKHIVRNMVMKYVHSDQDDDCIFTMLEFLANFKYDLDDSSIRSDLKINEFEPLKDTSVGNSVIGEILGGTLKIGLGMAFEAANATKNAARSLNRKFSEDEQKQIIQEVKNRFKTSDQINAYLYFYNLCV